MQFFFGKINNLLSIQTKPENATGNMTQNETSCPLFLTFVP